MAASDNAGEFVPSEQQLRDVDVQRSELALFAAKRTYWQYRGSLEISHAVSSSFAEFLEAVEKGNRAGAVSLLFSWGIRGAFLAAPLPYNFVRLSTVLEGQNTSPTSLERATMEPVLPGL